MYAEGLKKLVLVLIFSLGDASFACENLLSTKPEILRDGFRQWIVWEKTENIPRFRRAEGTVQIHGRYLEGRRLLISGKKENLALLPRLFNDSGALALKHPSNTSTVPAWSEIETNTELDAEVTASRSLILLGDLKGFSIKLGTNFPEGVRAGPSAQKSETADDLAIALLASEHIRSQDDVLGPDPTLAILPEIATVASVDNPNGYVIRDIRQLDDGHYYLPAFSIPWVGAQIARYHKADPIEFWTEHYARAFGVAKAKLLLRYGLQMETPNAQNVLIQLDTDLRPTGKVVLRDIGDSHLVDVMVNAYGWRSKAQAWEKLDYGVQKTIKPYSQNSFMHMEVGASEHNFTPYNLKLMAEEHNRAYLEYIIRELGSPRLDLLERDLPYATLDRLHKYLIAEGQSLIRRWRARTAPIVKDLTRDKL